MLLFFCLLLVFSWLVIPQTPFWLGCWKANRATVADKTRAFPQISSVSQQILFNFSFLNIVKQPYNADVFLAPDDATFPG